jgi:cellobiose-specific phosphotransferase system component IIA
MRSTPKILILFSISVLFNAGNAYSQNLQSLSSLIPNKSKEIEKALDDIAEAGKITQEANNYYNEAQQLQSNYDLDEKTLQKELSKTEEKALELQLRADKLYSSAHKLLNKLCTDEINNQGVSYGESESYVTAASDLMNQATAKREDANHFIK